MKLYLGTDIPWAVHPNANATGQRDWTYSIAYSIVWRYVSDLLILLR